jgi:hypothetical protein
MIIKHGKLGNPPILVLYNGKSIYKFWTFPLPCLIFGWYITYGKKQQTNACSVNVRNHGSQIPKEI